jgi:hypothetical protein
MEISFKGQEPEYCPNCHSKTLQEFQYYGSCGHDLHAEKYTSLGTRIKHNFIFYAATGSSLIAGLIMAANHF